VRHGAIRREPALVTNKPERQYDEAGLNARYIVATALQVLGQEIKLAPARA